MNKNSLRSLEETFTALSPPEVDSLKGFYQAESVGPGWLRRISGPYLALVGLGGWWGKVFDGQGGGENLVSRGESLARVLPVELHETASLVDGKPVIALVYEAGSRFPWPWVVDELRQVEEGHLLGMAVLNVGWLPSLAFPFMLHRREDMAGE